MNASSMLSQRPAQHLTIVNSVPLSSGEYGVEGTYSVVGKSFGFSAGYLGTVGSTSSHGFLAGIAARINRFSLGVGVSKSPGSSSSPSADASVTLPVMDNMFLTSVLKNLISSPKVVVGLGLRDWGFQLELFVELPPFSTPAAGNSVGAALTFGIGNWSFHGAGKQQTVTKAYGYTVGLGRALNEKIHLSVQYDDLQRVNVGFTLGL